MTALRVSMPEASQMGGVGQSGTGSRSQHWDSFSKKSSGKTEELSARLWMWTPPLAMRLTVGRDVKAFY